MKYKHLFFDMDGTITPSRSKMLPEMEKFLSSIDEDLIVVSGSSNQQMRVQIPNLKIFQLGQNGNHVIDQIGTELWWRPLNNQQKQEINDHIEKLIAILPQTPKPDWTPVEDRGAQITFSPIGNTAPVEVKKQYDPDSSVRTELLKRVPFTSNTGMVIKIAGSTSFDYLPESLNKGTNIMKFIDLMKWDKAECVYFGDMLFPGGNDESVIGIINTISVKDPEDCLVKLKELYL